MFKEDLKKDLSTFVICFFIALLIFVLVSGCKSLPIWNNNSIQTNPAPTPTEQLWQTVKKSNWLVTFSIPIIALGVVAIFNGVGKLGISVIIFGCVNLFMSLATSRFALIMAVFGLIGSIAVVAVSILVKNKALKEIICGVQTIKQTAKNDNVDLVFQDKIKETLSKQVKSTQKLVTKVKTTLKSKGEI